MKRTKRAPVRLHDASLTDLLGTLDRIVLEDGRELRWSGREARAYWDPASKSLVAFHGAGRRPKMKRDAQGGAAANAFTRWTGREQRNAGTMVVDVPDTWQRFGRSATLDYTSKKWKTGGQAYTHETTTRPTVWRLGGTRPPWVWVVRGGGFTLTTRGLIG